jgi:hypothetical protein
MDQIQSSSLRRRAIDLPSLFKDFKRVEIAALFSNDCSFWIVGRHHHASATLQHQAFDLNSIEIRENILNHKGHDAKSFALHQRLEMWPMTWRVDTIDLCGLVGMLALGVVLLTCGTLP